MNDIDPNKVNWFKSSYSSGDGACVEVATTEEAVAVRDTVNRDLGHLLFPGREWRAFVRDVQAGRYDR